MPLIDVYASQPNYWRHLAPIARELRDRGHDVRAWASVMGRPWGPRIMGRRERAHTAVCASWEDARRISPQRVCYVEHGAGQTYLDGGNEDGRGYAGAEGLEHVVLFLAPGDHVAAQWRARYPQTPVETVGCPALDQHFLRARDFSASTTMSVVEPRYNRVAVTEHWRCGVVPETMPAVPLFDRAIAEISRVDGIEVVGHAHPRGVRSTVGRWRDLGIPYEPDPDSVLRTADLLVADNTSLMYEAAALDIPVLAINGPDYRRDVEHGLRFWSHVPGIQCDSVGTFIPAVMAALDDPPEARALRARAASHTYAHRDGRSAQRAADAIESVI